MNANLDFLIGVAPAGVAFVWLDALTKRFVEARRGRPLAWGAVVQFRRVPNTRHLNRSSLSRIGLVLVWCAAFLCAMILHASVVKFRGSLALAGLGMAFGGAAANLFDIVRRRPIIDFIDFGWWPVFNVADIAIVGGLIVAFLNAG